VSWGEGRVEQTQDQHGLHWGEVCVFNFLYFCQYLYRINIIKKHASVLDSRKFSNYIFLAGDSYEYSCTVLCVVPHCRSRNKHCLLFQSLGLLGLHVSLIKNSSYEKYKTLIMNLNDEQHAACKLVRTRAKNVKNVQKSKANKDKKLEDFKENNKDTIEEERLEYCRPY